MTRGMGSFAVKQLEFKKLARGIVRPRPESKRPAEFPWGRAPDFQKGRLASKDDPYPFDLASDESESPPAKRRRVASSDTAPCTSSATASKRKTGSKATIAKNPKPKITFRVKPDNQKAHLSTKDDLWHSDGTSSEGEIEKTPVKKRLRKLRKEQKLRVNAHMKVLVKSPVNESGWESTSSSGSGGDYVPPYVYKSPDKMEYEWVWDDKEGNYMSMRKDRKDR